MTNWLRDETVPPDPAPDPFHALRAAIEKATPGPWTFSFREGWAYPNTVVGEDRPDVDLDDPVSSFCREIIRPEGTDPGGVFCTRGKLEYEMANAECIALMRNNIEPLLAALEARAEVGRLKRICELATLVRDGKEERVGMPRRGDYIQVAVYRPWWDELRAALRGEGERKP